VKLVFYSGGDEEDNENVDQACLDLIDNPNPTFVFIPSSSYDGEAEFHEFVESWQDYGITRFIYFPVDIPQDRVLMKEVFQSDLIHLGGGNTFYFLKYLRQYGYLEFLREYVLMGKVLTGLSAGAIMMTPNIKTASYPSFDRDENEEGVRNLKALGLVRFEFFPHYKNSLRYDRELLAKSKNLRHPLFALPDGSGLIKNEEQLSFIGKAWAFKNGTKILINSES
tara:strand:+ start:33436 stop:34107 length:672 start_codon:yes stop_codon:yes gene_type:complete